MEETIEIVRECIDELCELIKGAKLIIFAAFDFEEIFKKCYVFVAGKFYSEYKLELDDDAVDLISRMIGEIHGEPLSRQQIEEEASHNSIGEYFHDYFPDWAVNQLVKIDKIAINKNGIDFEDGATIVHHNTMRDFLEVLCEYNDISFDESAFCSECMTELEDVITDKWGSTNMILF